MINHTTKAIANRLLVAFVVGLFIAFTSYLCAYFNQRGAYGLVTGEPFSIRHVQHAIETHREKAGRWPTSLAEVEDLKDRLNDQGQFLNPWNHPYQYRVEGDKYELYSLGKDGQPGGEGLDADLQARNRPEPPTLRQFTLDLPTGGVLAACILSGVCAGLFCLMQKRDLSRRSFYLRLGATAIGAILLAVVISVLHIPSGH
ncbi:MAG: type II secretion system protein GspG [Gemmatales bacterium]